VKHGNILSKLYPRVALAKLHRVSYSSRDITTSFSCNVI